MDKNKILLMELWDKVAVNFGELGPDYWKRFGKKLVELSNVDNGDYILDIGTGRGSSLFPSAYLVGKDGRVIGTDISKSMVSATNDEIAKRNIINAEVIQVDIEALNFDDEYFDKIIAGFSLGGILMNEEYLQNLIHTLKNHGQLSFSMWGVQNDQQWLTDIVNDYIKPVQENKSENITSIRLDCAEGIKAVLKNAGLKDIETYETVNEVIYIDATQWWTEMWNNALRNIFETIEKMGQDIFDEFKNKVNIALQNFKSEKGITFKMNVIYAVCKKY